jgi:aldehyde dehydrogenase (NAD+)/betaine-aldehyde dehydrogenase
MTDTLLTERDALLMELGSSPAPCLVGSRWEQGESEQVFSIVDPSTSAEVATVRGASVRQAEAAVQEARRAFDDGKWASTRPALRSRWLHELADRFEAEAARFAQLLVTEIGSPAALVHGAQIEGPIDLLRWFADAAASGPRPGFDETLSTHYGPVRSRSLLAYEPIGVVAGITAYNFPLLLLIRKLGGALAAGCSMVIMPSPRAPLSTIAFLRLVHELELPPGTVNLVVGGPDVGHHITTHPGVDMVTFTGSRKVGEMVMVQAARGIKRVVLELGGKSANVVLPGFDVESAVRPSLMRFSLNAGQGCGATTRTFVVKNDYAAYVESARQVFDGLPVGSAHDPATVIGPLIRAEQQTFVNGYVDRALSSGGCVEAAVPWVPDEGFFVSPQLIGGVDNESEIAREELFGPVGVIMAVDSVEEAVRLANDNRFGLNANIWGPLPDALKVARQLRTGNVTINGGGTMRQDVPWGGYRESGIGREGGEAGFREFFEIKHIQWPT